MSSTNHGTPARPPASEMSLDFHAPKKPRGWKADKESKTLFGINEAVGPKFYVAGGAAGAWATWEESMGIYFVLDCNDSTRFTLDEMRAYHADFGTMLDQVEAAMAR